MNVLVQNRTIITMHNRRIIHQGAIAMEDKKIIGVGKNRELKERTEENVKELMGRTKLSYQRAREIAEKAKTVFWNALARNVK